jgi:hypothetical protein
MDEDSPDEAPAVIVTIEGSNGFSLGLVYDLAGIDWFVQKFDSLRYAMWWRMAKYLAVSNSNLDRVHLVKKGELKMPSQVGVNEIAIPALCGAKPSHPVWNQSRPDAENEISSKQEIEETEKVDRYVWLGVEPLLGAPRSDEASNYCKKCYAAWLKAQSGEKAQG